MIWSVVSPDLRMLVKLAEALGVTILAFVQPAPRRSRPGKKR
jgi:hypothetical protein